MLVLITYDVNTETAAGKRRLRQVAKACQNYGQRVQNSVFECLFDQAQAKQMEKRLLDLIEPKTDSLRFYYLGNRYAGRVVHFGAKQVCLPEDTLMV